MLIPALWPVHSYLWWSCTWWMRWKRPDGILTLHVHALHLEAKNHTLPTAECVVQQLLCVLIVWALHIFVIDLTAMHQKWTSLSELITHDEYSNMKSEREVSLGLLEWSADEGEEDSEPLSSWELHPSANQVVHMSGHMLSGLYHYHKTQLLSACGYTCCRKKN